MQSFTKRQLQQSNQWSVNIQVRVPPIKVCAHRVQRLNVCLRSHIPTTTVTLGNGLVLRHFTSEELNFLYQEVYLDRVYLRHGVSIHPGDTVVDVGANTGLFTLLAAQEAGPAGRVVSLEPLPATFDLLQRNVAAHAEWSAARGRPVAAPVLLNCGAGAPGRSSATFVTYSERASGWSTMYPDDVEVAENMGSYIEQLLGGGRGAGAADGGGGGALDTSGGSGGGGGGGGGKIREEGMPAVTTDAGREQPQQQVQEQVWEGEHRGEVPEPALARLGRVLWRLPPLRPLLRAAGALYVRLMLSGQRRWKCLLVPLSSLITARELDRIDLLKVDVERAELDVLAGLGATDWPRVRQLVLEVHDLNGRLAAVRQLLAAQGFSRVVSEQDARLTGSTIHLVYARRE